MRTKLNKITIAGYKSFSANEPQEVTFGDINVLIGANGAGKSNFVSFFKMLNSILEGRLQEYVEIQGGANSLLHYGVKTTEVVQGDLMFNFKGTHNFLFKLVAIQPDKLVFETEQIRSVSTPTRMQGWIGRNNNDIESVFSYDGENDPEELHQAKNAFEGISVFQFHDTGAKSLMRSTTPIDANHYLYSDGGNLAAYLLGMKSTEKYLPYYQRIVQWVKNIFPQFGDFILEASPFNPNTTMLNWREKGSEYIFGPHQISDGTLRFMALATLLMQPPDLLPNLLIIDEPELGLHPAAIGALAGMVRTASQHCQVILATQSPRLLDEFSAEEIIVAERDDRKQCSLLKRLNEEELNDWLEAYSLSELWEKNVFGGQP